MALKNNSYARFSFVDECFCSSRVKWLSCRNYDFSFFPSFFFFFFSPLFSFIHSIFFFFSPFLTSLDLPFSKR